VVPRERPVHWPAHRVPWTCLLFSFVLSVFSLLSQQRFRRTL